MALYFTEQVSLPDLRTSFQDNGGSSTESRNSTVVPKSNQRTPSVRGATTGPSEETPCKEIAPTPKVVSIVLHNPNFCLLSHGL
jgi:hypothetical protein